ncbi:hypothetical protein BGZ60DRAFT_520024 [Tricladium varicosporioides]|nr:hypothetical protein BGZ60DRAFT_520024 [Hymenoscyphus varicosporioides]
MSNLLDFDFDNSNTMSFPKVTPHLGDFGGIPRSNDQIFEQEFVSSCPPDFQPNTRIIAVCGVSDLQGHASPRIDGWFLSDFYLFHYLLQNSPTFSASSQLWLTCCDPEYLVKKYKNYVHGPWKGDRRIVLDDQLLQNHLQTNDIRVFKPRDLLERFLATLKSEIEIAQRNKQSVLVFVFGHGEEDNHGVGIGGSSMEDAPRLTRQSFNTCLKKDVDVSLVITSCFSGGWIQKPLLLSPHSTEKRKLNITAAAGAGEDNVSLSWALTKSIGRRAGGGMMATFLLKALTTSSENSTNFNTLATDLESRITTTPDGESIEENPTYVQLSKSVRETLKRIDPAFWDQHKISFAAQDDKWDTEWRTRSGFPLLNYRKRWEELRQLPAGEQIWPDGYIAEICTGGAPTRKSQQNIIYEKAKYFMQSYPGDINTGANSCHRSFISLLNNEEISDEFLVTLNNILDYRINLMSWATLYAQIMGVDSITIFEMDCEKWKRNMVVSNPETYERFKIIRDYIKEIKIFEKPMREQGQTFEKPKDYLAIALASSNMERGGVKRELDILKIVIYNTQKFATKLPTPQKVMTDKAVVLAKEAVKNWLKTLGKRARPLSPRKGQQQL